MDLEQAIKGRRSIRAYKPDPVPKNILMHIMEVAIQSPSSANMQPWSFEIVGGSVLDEFIKASAERTLSGAGPAHEVPLYPYSYTAEPKRVPDIYRKRRSEVVGLLYDALGIARGEDEKRFFWYLNVDHVFGAPNLIIICVERGLAPWAIMDIGSVMHAIMLLAHSYGLGTCAMGRAVQYPDILRKLLNIPENRLIVVGIAMGYPDPASPVNKVKSGREPLDSLVTWHGT